MRRMNVMLGVAMLLAALALPTVARAQAAKIPQTAADHLALAKSYQEKAAAYRKEVADHKAMAEAYKKSSAPGGKSTGENPWAKKMEEHCRAIAADAEKLAVDADKAAEFHMLRAKELQGK